MLYDFGPPRLINEWLGGGIILLGCLGVFGMLCIMLAVAVRIGNWIIGW